MSDVKCPYCGEDNEINHDDGYGYNEDSEYYQECSTCDRDFKFITSISFSYEVYCQDGEHDMEPFGDKWPDMYECKNCDFFEKRQPLPEPPL